MARARERDSKGGAMTLRSSMTWGMLALGIVGWQGTALARQHAAHAGATVKITNIDFVKHAAQGGMAEVELGKLATERAENADVKQFAQRMIDDHAKATDELKQLAGEKSLDVPKDMNAEQKATMNRLSKLSGARFDREYMKAMTKDHDHDVAMFQSYARDGRDQDLKAWAAKTLPTLEEHQRLAVSTATKVGVGIAAGRHRTQMTAHSGARNR
jgi:putative membrane protein